LLDIGFCLFEAAGKEIGVASHPPQREIRIDCQPGVGRGDRLVRAVRIVKVDAFDVIRPPGVGRECDGSVGRAEYLGVIVGLGVNPLPALENIGVGAARQRIGIVGVNLEPCSNRRPMRANARAILIEALGDAHRWLDELLSDPRQTLETLASREGKTERSIRMTVSLAFLAPDIVKSAVEGRLPRGYGLKRLIDLPLAWPDQWRTLGLETPARA